MIRYSTKYWCINYRLLRYHVVTCSTPVLNVEKENEIATTAFTGIPVVWMHVYLEIPSLCTCNCMLIMGCLDIYFWIGGKCRSVYTITCSNARCPILLASIRAAKNHTLFVCLFTFCFCCCCFCVAVVVVFLLFFGGGGAERFASSPPGRLWYYDFVLIEMTQSSITT